MIERLLLRLKLDDLSFRAVVLALAGVALGTLTIQQYLTHGYGFGVLLAWIGSLACLYLSLGRADPATQPSTPKLDRSDRWLILILLAAFAPAYLVGTFQIPVQVSSDELTIALVSKELTSQGLWDVFSVSGYFNFPSLQFIMFGFLGRLAGGITLQNMRLIHALLGLSIVPLAFLLFRAIGSRREAMLATVLLGSNHALITISRMAMRDNSALLLEVAALVLLVRGFKQGSSRISYLGGAIAGLTFYFYEPGRLTILIWVAAGLAVVLHKRTRDWLQPQARQLAIGLVGFAAVVAPILAHSAQAASEPGAFRYQREQLLFSSEGLALQQEWVEASSRAEAARINIVQGLTAFNRPLHDHGYIYYNPGYGFVDPLTGILIWVGLAFAVGQARRRGDPALLMAPGLLLPWLIFSFVTIKAPSYTRLLITLPFVSYFSMRALTFLADLFSGYLEGAGLQSNSIRLSTLLTVPLIASIVGWNLYAFGDFALTGLRRGDDVGNTGRYVAARTSQPDHSFYVAADDDHPYAPYASQVEPWRWVEWVEFFATEDQLVEVTPPAVLDRFDSDVPFTIFMNSELWFDSAQSLTRAYPDRQVHSILADGAMLAIEVQRGADDE